MNKQFLSFNKHFFKDTMRFYLLTAIALGAASAVISSAIGYALCGASAVSSNFHIATTQISLLICAFMLYLGKSLSRKLIDVNTAELYGSVPVSRDSMWTVHLLAGISYCLAIVLAGIIGLVAGEVFGAISTGAQIGNYGYSVSEVAVSLCKGMVAAVICFAITGIAYSVTGKSLAGFITAVIACGAVINCFIAFRGENYRAGDIGNILFPFGAKAQSAAAWIVSIAVMLGLLLLFRKTFISTRSECWSSAFKNKRIQTVVGLMLAFSQFANSVALGKAGLALTGENEIIELLTTTVVTSLLYYFIFMWISGKSFKKAARSLMYLPIAYVLTGLVILTGNVCGKAYDKVDFSVNNIAYFTVPKYHGKGTWNYDHYESMIMLDDMKFYNDKFGKGVTNEDDIRISDPQAIAELSKIIRERKNDANIFVDIYYEPTAYVTLKDGRTYAVNVLDDTDYTYNKLGNMVLSNEEYRAAMYDMERFRKGHFVLESRCMDALYNTFIDELSALTLEQREALFDISKVYTNLNSFTEPENYENYEYMIPSCARVIFIANGDNSCIRGIILNESTPKTLEAYLKLANELNVNHSVTKEFIASMEAAKVNSVDTEFMVWDKETGKSYACSIDLGRSGLKYDLTYSPNEEQRAQLEEFLLESFNIPISGLSEEEVCVAFIAFTDLYYGEDSYDYYDYYGETKPSDDDDLRKDFRNILDEYRELLDEYQGRYQYINMMKGWMSGAFNTNADLDNSRYVLIVNSCTTYAEWDYYKEEYPYYEKDLWFHMDSIESAFDYPISVGLNQESFDEFISQIFNSAYDSTEGSHFRD